MCVPLSKIYVTLKTPVTNTAQRHYVQLCGRRKSLLNTARASARQNMEPVIADMAPFIVEHGHARNLIWLCATSHQMYQTIMPLVINLPNDSDNGGTRLHRAAFQNDTVRARQLLDLGATVDSAGTDGRTPLVWAVQNGARFSRQMVQLLIDHRANPRAIASGNTALHWAARSGSHRGIEWLTTVIGVDSRNSEAATPLMLAATNGNEEALEALLHATADVQLVDDDGWLPIHFASKAGSIACVKALLHASRGRHSKVQREFRTYESCMFAPDCTARDLVVAYRDTASDLQALHEDDINELLDLLGDSDDDDDDDDD